MKKPYIHLIYNTDTPRRILVVDDEIGVRNMIRSILESIGHEVEIARDGFEALAKLELDIDLVFLDVQMPGIDGFEVARRIRESPRHCDIPILMVTGRANREDRIRSAEAGANDFIAKPFDFTEINVRTASLLRMKDANDALKSHKIDLQETVKRRTSALRKALDDTVNTQRKLEEAYLETIHRLVVAAEFKDSGTAAHIRRMSRFSAMLAREINLPPSEIELIRHASPMHDIGKIGTPEDILLKPGKLNDNEWGLMKQHTLYGARILEDSSSKLLKAGEIIALSHHEKWDGSGYPNGLAGEEIHLWGRISAVADVFDALTSKRPYKIAFSNETALDIIMESSGKHLDPQLVEIFIGNMDEVVKIQMTHDS